MARKKYVITLNESQEKAMQELMRVNLQTTLSGLVSVLILDAFKEMKRTKLKDKRDVDDKDLSIYPHPSSPGVMLNRTELEQYYELQGRSVPHGTFTD